MSTPRPAPDEPLPPVSSDPALTAASPLRTQIDSEVFGRLSHLFRRAGTGATTQSLFGVLYEARTTRRKES